MIFTSDKIDYNEMLVELLKVKSENNVKREMKVTLQYILPAGIPNHFLIRRIGYYIGKGIMLYKDSLNTLKFFIRRLLLLLVQETHKAY